MYARRRRVLVAGRDVQLPALLVDDRRAAPDRGARITRRLVVPIEIDVIANHWRLPDDPAAGGVDGRDAATEGAAAVPRKLAEPLFSRRHALEDTTFEKRGRSRDDRGDVRIQDGLPLQRGRVLVDSREIRIGLAERDVIDEE